MASVLAVVVQDIVPAVFTQSVMWSRKSETSTNYAGPKCILFAFLEKSILHVNIHSLDLFRVASVNPFWKSVLQNTA
jgi:hypothetical protein